MVDDRMKKVMDLLDKERTVADATKAGGKSKILRLLPLEDGKVYDNRLVLLLWRPAIICPEVFGEFYPEDMWDFKAAVRGHWISDEAAGETSFVYCPVGTAEYYSKWLGKDFGEKHCDHCGREKPSGRYIFQAFDYLKLIGEKPLDEGEERPCIQVLAGPQMIYNQLWNKLKVGIEFWGNKITRITKDTKKGFRYSDYTVEIEGNDPEELKVPEIAAYLNDEKNFVNPVPEVIKMFPGDKSSGGARKEETKRDTQPASQTAGPSKGRIRW